MNFLSMRDPGDEDDYLAHAAPAVSPASEGLTKALSAPVSFGCETVILDRDPGDEDDCTGLAG